MMNNKYNAHKTTVNGIVFDSKKEARRYTELLAMQGQGIISDLHRQVSYELIAAQREPDTTGPRGGVIKGKTIERAVYYFADFTYVAKDGTFVCEDVKSKVTRTDAYKIKRKLLLERYGIRITEV